MTRILLYRTAGGYRWRRLAPGTPSRWSSATHPWKTALWRNVRRENPDWRRCLIDDRTFTWWRPGGAPRLPRPQDTAPPPPRPLPDIRQARKRL